MALRGERSSERSVAAPFSDLPNKLLNTRCKFNATLSFCR